MQKLALSISGMTCNHCASSAEQALNLLAGVQATVSFENQLADITSDGQTSTAAILGSIEDEGYSAPGEVIKTGNVKFEPPGGLETTKWIFHLEDTHGNRQSEDIPFHTDDSDKQWYFIKFRRKY